MAGEENVEYARRLGAEIRGRRLATGMSLRALAKELGLGGHGTLVDYEHGRRIPPLDFVVGCERVFQISDGLLRDLRDKALAERAGQRVEQWLAAPRPDQVQSVGHRNRRRGRVITLVGVVAAAALGVGIWQWTDTPTSTARPAPSAVLPASRTVVAGWGVCWGGQVATIEPTNVVTYNGARTLQVTVTKPNSAGDFAVCTAHGLDTVHPGMHVSVYLRTPAAEAEGGVAFFVYDSHHAALWAPETHDGYRAPMPDGNGWRRYVWTVPAVDTVLAMGVEVYSTRTDPLIVWLGAVTW